MKTYKHKTLWWIANFYHGWIVNDYIVKDENWIQRFWELISEWILIEIGFEEVIEKDWIDDCIFDLHQWCEISWHRKIQKKVLRNHIEKHAPKQVKVTNRDISDFAVSKSKDYNEEIIVRGTLELFLRQHNLLSSDE